MLLVKIQPLDAKQQTKANAKTLYEIVVALVDPIVFLFLSIVYLYDIVRQLHIKICFRFGCIFSPMVWAKVVWGFMFGVLDRFESVGTGCTQDRTGTSGIGQNKN